MNNHFSIFKDIKESPIKDIVDTYYTAMLTGNTSNLPNISLSTFKTIIALSQDSNSTILKEIVKLLLSQNIDYLTLFKMNNCFLLRGLFADIPENFYNTPQNNIYHVSSVLNHSLLAMSHYSGREWLVRFILLLHDLGKTQTITEDDMGYHHFYGHCNESVVLANIVLDNLGFNKDIDDKSKLPIKDLVLTVIAHHDEKIPVNKRSFNSLFEKITKDLPESCNISQKITTMSIWMNVKLCDILAHNLYNSENLLTKIFHLKSSFEYYTRLLKLADARKNMPISGHDVIEIMTKKHKLNKTKIGYILDRASKHYLDSQQNEKPNRDEMLNYINKLI